MPFCSWIKISFLLKVLLLISKAYSKPCQTSRWSFYKKYLTAIRRSQKAPFWTLDRVLNMLLRFTIIQLISIIIITFTSILLSAPVMRSKMHQSFAIAIKFLINFKVLTFGSTANKCHSQKGNYITHTFFFCIWNISSMLTC